MLFSLSFGSSSGLCVFVYACVCVCIFLYCLLVYNSTGSFIKYGGRPTRCLAGEYNDELTPVWRGWPFSFRTGCQRRDLQKAPMPHKEKKKRNSLGSILVKEGLKRPALDWSCKMGLPSLNEAKFWVMKWFRNVQWDLSVKAVVLTSSYGETSQLNLTAISCPTINTSVLNDRLSTLFLP